jgi:hypothetical protein
LSARRIAIGALATLGVLAVAASTAWACVSGPVVNLSTVHAKAGEEVTLTGTGFRQPHDVLVRFNALDGPVLASPGKPTGGNITATFTVPPGTAPGNYVIIVSQTNDGALSLSPVRAVLSVVGPSGQTPVVGAAPAANTSDRTEGLVRSDNSVSAGTLALVALGVAGMGMFTAGIAALMASRRGATARPVPVSKG